MRLATTERAHCLRSHGCEVAGRVVDIVASTKETTTWICVTTCGRGGGRDRMCMGRQFRNGKRVALLAATLAKRVAGTEMNRRAALQIWQGKRSLSVAAVGGSKQ